MAWWLWILVAIVLPLFLPVGALCLAWYECDDNEEAQRAVHPLQGLKDGQLLWFSIMLAFTGITEACTTEAKQFSSVNICFIVFLGLFVGASLFLLGRNAGKVKPLPDGTFWVAFKKLRLLKCSLWITLFTVVSCIIVHARLPK